MRRWHFQHLSRRTRTPLRSLLQSPVAFAAVEMSKDEDFDDSDLIQKPPCESDNKSPRCAFERIAPWAIAFMCAILLLALVFGLAKRFISGFPFEVITGLTH